MATLPQESVPVEVPFVDLTVVHAELRERLLAKIGDLIDANAYINGPAVGEFEAAFAAYCGSEDCVGVASGFAALHLSLTHAGIEPGDEVIVPANTFAATAAAVVFAGGRPVIVDAGERDYNVDLEAVEAAITPRTRFLLPVHLYGQLADMRGLTEIAQRHELLVVEDACQAHGADRDGLRPGEAAVAAAFSFYPSKNLGALGDAGALVTDDATLASQIRAHREHGQTRKNHHEFAGSTDRIDTLHAIVLLEKLAYLDDWNASRREAAAYYIDGLAAVGDVEVLPVPPGSHPVWHLFPIRTADSTGLEAFLRERAISTGRHYPTPIHLMPAFAELGSGEGSCPVAESLARELITLPIFPGIREDQLDAVIQGVRDYFGQR
jgi:dTDP-3-amino-3,4,6-trideoxy-alpha-D-glucose transaminase